MNLDGQLTHIDSSGAANMVDVSGKDITRRSATASAKIRMNGPALQAIKQNELSKGDALSVARIAGIFAAKKVDELIPLCHSLPLSSVEISFEFEETGIRILAKAVTDARTGVEMEVLTACSLAALTVYDMAKSIDRAMIISDIKLLRKSGGKSGDFVAKDET